MLPSIFGENLFDDFFGDPFGMMPRGRDPLYGKGLDKSESDKKGKYIRQERYAGACSRSFYVGDDVEPEDVSAKFEDGILTITVPKAVKKQLPKSSSISIQ